MAAPTAAAGRRAAVVATAGGLLVSTIAGASAAQAAPVDTDAAKKLSTVDLGALTDQARQALEAAPVVAVDAEAKVDVEKVTAKVVKKAAIKAAPEPEPVVERTVAPSRSAERTEVSSSSSSSSSSESTSSESTSTTASSSQAASGSSAVSIAARYIGVPYVVGGASPSGFDCSGLVTYVYNQLGVSLPHSSSAIRSASNTTVISASEARPGDLIWSPGHISIYIGDGQQIEATRPGGWTVRQAGIWQSSPTYLRVTG
ncbi:C40 family peptidase [Isoptericola jiangsuensis]|uniref:C40 family peptidase n=1 Tax=Isoptericola jiangsuensis TaxID=548579 RepID=UPI003AAB7120